MLGQQHERLSWAVEIIYVVRMDHFLPLLLTVYNHLTLFSDFGGHGFNGTVRLVRIYDHAMNPDELQTAYEAFLARDATPSPTGTPTTMPTTSMPTTAPSANPTRHPCDAGNHNCTTEFGICEQMVGDPNYPAGYRCSCISTHHCSDGDCKSPDHICVRTTQAPTTSIPTTEPPTTSAPTTGAPTVRPTAFPSMVYQWCVHEIQFIDSLYPCVYHPLRPTHTRCLLLNQSHYTYKKL